MIAGLTTAIQNVSAVLIESCNIVGRTAAYCNYTFSETGTHSTYTEYTTIITGDSYFEYPVVITSSANGTGSNVPSITPFSSTLSTPTTATGPTSEPTLTTSNARSVRIFVGTNFIVGLVVGLCVISWQ